MVHVRFVSDWRCGIYRRRVDRTLLGVPGIATNGARTLRTGLLAVLLVTRSYWKSLAFCFHRPGSRPSQSRRGHAGRPCRAWARQPDREGPFENMVQIHLLRPMTYLLTAASFGGKRCPSNCRKWTIPCLVFGFHGFSVAMPPSSMIGGCGTYLRHWYAPPKGGHFFAFEPLGSGKRCSGNRCSMAETGAVDKYFGCIGTDQYVCLSFAYTYTTLSIIH